MRAFTRPSTASSRRSRQGRRASTASTSSTSTPSCGARRRPPRRGHRSPAPRRPRPHEDLRRLRAAVAHTGQPTVILAKTKKGYGMGERGAGPHDDAPGEEARQRRPASPSATASRCRSPTTTCITCASTSPPTTAPRCATCTPARARSAATLPARRTTARRWPCRRSTRPRAFALHADGKEMSTTMAFVRMLCNLLKDAGARPAHRADRRRRGAHLRHGEPVPPGRHLLAARPALRARGPGRAVATARHRSGQILEEGITEAGALVVVDRRGDRRTRRTAWRCCRSTSTTRCSASSASAT